jgi:hypothetical protein
MRQAVAEMLRHLLPPRRLRSLPRVVKRKMRNFALRRDRHRYWPQPTKPPDEAVVIEGQLPGGVSAGGEKSAKVTHSRLSFD